MLTRIREQIKRLDYDLEADPKFDHTSHEAIARYALQEIAKMRKLLEDIDRRDRNILFLFFQLYLDIDNDASNGTKYAITKTIEQIAGDKIEKFIELYEKPAKGAPYKWPECDPTVDVFFKKDTDGKTLDI